jgi:ethanolamine utilization microcompartment shell protein EutS
MASAWRAAGDVALFASTSSLGFLSYFGGSLIAVGSAEDVTMNAFLVFVLVTMKSAPVYAFLKWKLLATLTACLSSSSSDSC